MANIIPVPIRRFEMGASGMGSDEFLVKRGYEVKAAQGGKPYAVRYPDGREKRLRYPQVIRLLDDERIRAGLEPIQRRGE